MSCTFETSFCGFTQDKTDDFDFTRRMGTTPSYDTGPTIDHTLGTNLGESRDLFILLSLESRLDTCNSLLLNWISPQKIKYLVSTMICSQYGCRPCHHFCKRSDGISHIFRRMRRPGGAPAPILSL